MRKLKNRKLTEGVLLILIATCSSVTATYITYMVYQGTIPSYTYPLQLNAGDQIHAILSWPSTQDLDLYLYPQGYDLLSRGTWLDREYSGSLNPENLIYTVSESKLYYLRVDLYSTTPTSYTFQIKVNGVLLQTHYDTVLTVTSGLTVQQFSTNNACSIKVIYSGPPNPIQVFAPGLSVVSGTVYYSNTTLTSPKTFEVTLSQSGLWNVVIKHSLTSVTTLTPFTMTILTETSNECINFCTGKSYSLGLMPGTTNICRCQDGFIWNSSTQKCVINCSSFPYTTTIVQGTIDSCNCQNEFMWSQEPLGCLIECDAIADAVSNIDSGTCQCRSSFEWERSELICVRECSVIPFTLGLLSGSLSICECEHKFFWNASSERCEIDCSLIPDYRSTVNFRICTCRTGFYWVSSVLECRRNCSAIIHSNGPVFGIIHECSCEDFFQWDPLLETCLIQCDSISNAIMLEPGTTDRCVCNTGLEWNRVIKKCMIICDQILNALSVVQGTYERCECEFGFAWDSLNMDCR